jgi:hypothetical protein
MSHSMNHTSAEFTLTQLLQRTGGLMATADDEENCQDVISMLDFDWGRRLVLSNPGKSEAYIS